ncbi:MAG: hypothetical protein NDI81_14890 [Desulfobacula sp.]|nr:hypothetical protein [Desulfobacula sp.]
MENEITQNECTDPTESMTIDLPCAMIERVQKLAAEKNTTLSNILIEALDSFLRKQILRKQI